MSAYSFKKAMHRQKVREKYPCACITKKGFRCGGIGTTMVEVLQRASVAYRSDALPGTHVGGGFLLNKLRVCEVHARVLGKGGAVRTITPMTPPVVQDTLPMEVPAPTPSSHGVLCGKCRKNKVVHPYHDNINQVKICYMRR